MYQSIFKPFAALALCCSSALAAPISFTFNAGEIFGINPAAPAIFQSFQLGEDMLVTVNVDDSVADTDPTANRGLFADPNGSFTLSGASSGAVLNIAGGVRVELDQSPEIDFQTELSEPTALVPFILDDDIDILFALPTVFSSPDNLASSLAEFIALLNVDGLLTLPNLALGSAAEVEFFDGSAFGEAGLVFGPVPSIPVPATLPAMLAGLLLLLGRKRKLARA